MPTTMDQAMEYWQGLNQTERSAIMAQVPHPAPRARNSAERWLRAILEYLASQLTIAN